MKQTIEIEVPDGKKAVWKDDKVVFENIKPQLPKTWEEFCKLNPTINTEYFFDNNCDLTPAGKGTRREENDRNILPSKQAAEAHLAYIHLHHLRDVWREGWLPDWNDVRQNKYAIISFEDKYEITELNFSSRFLAFQDEKTANEFLTNFRELIEQAGDLI